MKKNVKKKKSVLKLLEEIPIITTVCTKVGISRQTFYRWFAEDREFRTSAEAALRSGIGLVNDAAESVVIAGVQNKDSTYVRYWLSHRNPHFRKANMLDVYKLDAIIAHQLKPIQEKEADGGDAYIHSEAYTLAVQMGERWDQQAREQRAEEEKEARKLKKKAA